MPLYKNNTGETSQIGRVAKVSPNDPFSFVYATSSDVNVLGIITQSVPKYAQCIIQNTGVTKVYVTDRIVKGAIVRLQKSSDRVSRATCKTAKDSDAPYLKIGTALEAGKGLINTSLDITYKNVAINTANGTYTMGWGLNTDGTITVVNGVIVSIQEST